MTNWWLEEAKKRLLPLSREQNILENAIKEWIWTYDVIDLYPQGGLEEDDDPEFADGVEYNGNYAYCGLCGKERLRYVYRINNVFTNNFLYVGSKCIEKFDIASQDGIIGEERNKELKKRLRETKKATRQNHVIDCLEKCIDSLNKELYLDFIEYYKINRAFTPKQMLVIARRLDGQNRKYNPQFFKIKMRRDREKNQISQINPNDVIKYLFPIMTKSQKQFSMNILETELLRADEFLASLN